MMYTPEVESSFYVWENDIDTRIIEIDEKLREVLLASSSEDLANARASLGDIKTYVAAGTPDAIQEILPLEIFFYKSLEHDKNHIENYMLALADIIRDEIDEILMDRMIFGIYDWGDL